MFVPQSSYLPIGTLRAALTYPAPDGTYSDDQIHGYLDLCRLSHLKSELDVASNWGNRLSPGEQQRLAFARVFLSCPDMLFLDEASSALDGETEQHLYSHLLERLPQAAIVSIAHREAVERYHQQRWHFTPVAGRQTSALVVSPLVVSPV